MATLPSDSNNEIFNFDEVNLVQQPSKTYALDFYNTNKVAGYKDELKAMEQAIYKIVNTERYKYIIYSWNYGIELYDLIGQPIPYIYAETQRRIEEALLNDDRINKVYNFVFSNTSGDVLVTFDVDTIYGTVTDVEKVVSGVV